MDSQTSFRMRLPIQTVISFSLSLIIADVRGQKLNSALPEKPLRCARQKRSQRLSTSIQLLPLKMRQRDLQAKACTPAKLIADQRQQLFGREFSGHISSLQQTIGEVTF